jgi:ubiquinone/menaquinone biosynthesis C-methylase UbiE
VVQVAIHNIGQLLSIRHPGLTITSFDNSHAVIMGSESLRHRLCRGDVRDLSYLPSNSVDHVITFGVLFYLPNVDEVCRAAQELVRIVKPGGTVWFGCHQNYPDYDLPPLDYAFWTRCIQTAFPQTILRFLHMRQLLNSDLYDPDRRYSVFVDK